MVSERYRYGEWRLTKLNFITRIFLFSKLTFFHLHAQWGDFFGSFFAPILFAFAVFSIILSAMQVGLAVLAMGEVGGTWGAYVSASRGFSVFALLAAAVIVMLLGSLLVFFFVHDLYFARSVLRQERSRSGVGEGFEKEMKSGVI
jgi:hypothetical protein